MKLDSLHRMRTFTEDDLPFLTEATLGALELFATEGLPEVKFKDFKKPLCLGSGNAIVTAKILFSDKDAVFADETNYDKALQKDIDGVFIFSASGGKHAPIMAQAAKDAGFDVQVITCTLNSQAEEVVGKDNTIVTAKNREPYTYNTSTYMGWIFAKTREDPAKAHEFICKEVAPKIIDSIGSHSGYLLGTPDKFASLNQLFIVKFIELFGRQVGRDVKSYEEMRHAITVVPTEGELGIAFGDGELDVTDVLHIPLPEKCGLATMMAIVYFTIGRIQETKPQFFKENIRKYINRNKKGDFGKALFVIVE